MSKILEVGDVLCTIDYNGIVSKTETVTRVTKTEATTDKGTRLSRLCSWNTYNIIGSGGMKLHTPELQAQSDAAQIRLNLVDKFRNLNNLNNYALEILSEAIDKINALEK